MGLEFQKNLLMASGEIRASQKSDLTKMLVKFDLQHFLYVQITLIFFTLTNLQEHLIKKLGGNAFPFLFKLPHLQSLCNQVQKFRVNRAELNTSCGSLSETRWMIAPTKGVHRIPPFWELFEQKTSRDRERVSKNSLKLWKYLNIKKLNLSLCANQVSLSCCEVFFVDFKKSRF